ncbi:MAG: hypothetical protein AAF125_11990 [Chloroflexota bacterium]
MHKYQLDFEAALHGQQKIKIIMRRKGKPTPLIATCAPLDIGPKRNTIDDTPHFHVYKYGYKGNQGHVMSIAPDQLAKLDILDEPFDPAAVVRWDRTDKPWHLARDWGDLS